jgi:hypothetical protein
MHRISVRAGALALALALIVAGVLLGLARPAHDTAVTAAVTACQVGPDGSSLNVTFTGSDASKACADTIAGRAKRGEYWKPKQPVTYSTICDLMNDSGASVTVRGNLDADYEGRTICAAVLAGGGYQDVTDAGGN